MKRIFLFFLALSIYFTAYPQQTWPEMMADPNANMSLVKQNFEQYWLNKDYTQKGKGWKVFKRWEYFWDQRTYPSGNRSIANQAIADYYADIQNNASARSLNGNWSPLGPTNLPTGGGLGRVNFIRFDPTNSNIVYAGAPAGGLWRSTNGGVGWTVWNTDNLPVIGCTDLAIDPTNTQIMYLATGDGDANDTYSIGVLKSTDGGNTWNPTGLNWVVTNQRVIRKLLIDPNNPQTVYAASSNGIYKTTNGGTNWTQIRTGNFYDMEFKPGDPNTIYAAGTSFIYTNNATGLPGSGVIRIAIAVTPANPNYVYLLIARSSDYGLQGVYRSTNSGANFSTQATSPNLLGWNSTGSDAGGQGWYDLAIAASPTNADVVIVGGINIWRSTNGGVNWSINAHWTGSGAPYVHADIHDLIFLPGNGTTYYAGHDGGVSRTTNSGGAWTDLSNGLQIAQMYRLGTSATNTNLNLTGHQDNGTNRLNGTTWTEVIGGDGMECIIDYSNANIMYGELYYGNIRKSTNGGGTFSTIVNTGGTGVNANGNWVTPYVMHPTNNQTLIVGKANLYRTTNGGTGWTALGATTGGTGNFVAIAYAPSDPNYIYAAKRDRLFLSTNGGTSFTNITGTLPVGSAEITYIAVSNTNPQQVYVTFSGYSAANKVFSSTNAGGTWTNISSGLPNLPVNCIVYQNGSPDGIYVGTDVGVYYRDNTTGGWTGFSNGMPNVPVFELEIQYSSQRLRAATYGRGLWESDLYTPGNAPPVADFTANLTYACIGQTITFTDLSTNNPTSWSWSFSPTTVTYVNSTSSTSQNPQVQFNANGTYTVTLTATNPYGSDPEVKTAYITISSSQAPPLIEGFQSTTFLPTGWWANDVANDAIFWDRNTTVGGFGTSTASAWFDNYSNNSAGSWDEMWSPKMNTNGYTAFWVTFDVAYARYNATYSDSLRVLVSTDCGATWTSVYYQGGTNLATAPDNTNAFTPTATQWRKDSINLNTYINQPNVMIAFRNIGRWGNNLYLDNININGTPGAAPTASFTASSTNICAGTCINFTNTSTGTGNSYSWTFPGGTPANSTQTNPSNICFNTAGTYTVSLTATNGFGSSTATQVITVNANPNVTVNPSSPAICNGSSTTLTASGATSYTWTPATGLSCTNCASPTANPTATTTYTVTGTSGSCSGTANVTVTVNPLPNANATATPSTLCEGQNIALSTPTVSGATYAWTGPNGFTASIRNPTITAATTAASGTYTVTVTSSNGCTNTSNVTVTVNPTPVVTVSPSSPAICNGSSTTLTASGATSYTWTPATGLSCTNCAGPTANPTATTTYTVTGTSGSCSGTANVTVTVNPLPNASASATPSTLCEGQNIALSTPTVSGATYAWTGPNGFTASIRNPTITAATTAASGTYTVTVTSSNGCTNTSNVTVTVNALPTITVSPSSPTICSGQSVALTANGATTYTWTPATGLSTTTGATVTATLTATQTYTVTGTANGCSNTANVTVTVAPNLNITISPPNPQICAGSNIVITASGATNYTWSPAAGLSATTGASVTANPATTTTYTVNGTTGSCSGSTTFTLTVNALPVVSVNPNNAVICQGDSISLSASGAQNYSWTPTSDLNTSSGATVIATPQSSLTYTVTGTDANGCQNSDSVSLTVNAAPAAPTITQNGNVLTSSAAVTYQWYLNGNMLAGETNQSITITQNGTYVVVITGANGCSSSAAIDITNLSVQNMVNNNQVLILPNPNTGVFIMEIAVSDADRYSLEIVDAIGKLIYTENLLLQTHTYRKYIDLGNVERGIYFIQIKKQEKVISTTKFLIIE
jgi:PKD repeat protein